MNLKLSFNLSSGFFRKATIQKRPGGRRRKVPGQAPNLRLQVFNRYFSLSLLLLSLSLSAWPGNLPVARPGEVGLSAGRLERLGQVMQSYCEQKGAPGMVVLIARNGKVAYHRAFGQFRLDKPDPMPLDAIFRIASQSKAVTSVAVMILMEEGKLLLDDPVSKYIPEFMETYVAVKPEGKEAKGYGLVPAKRQITIRDLLTHTAGISYGDGPARDEYLKAGIHGWFLTDKDMTIGEVVKKLVKLPFDSQPGERYVYGYNTDILGYLVEVVSGMTLADFVAKRITGPLGMKDTHFFLPENKVARLTPAYGLDENGRIKMTEDPAKSLYVYGPRKCYSGGAGLLATAEDYARFLLMLQNGGELGGTRILSPKSVELMTADHVGQLYSGGTTGFGLGFWVTKSLGTSGLPGSVGAFGWGGAYFTSYWVDPAEKLVAVFMIQLLPVPASCSDLQNKFRTLVYQSIEKSYSLPGN
ncbi:MAG: serine hydrolase domain-containing protein [Candidatus Saccharicenans sp.]|uniref:serine hydrolase domain-containing protein n=1 Tax=Candidatus Saccharicenans sp. TaxID=2819258 RepID=UPI00404A4A99